MFGIVLRTDTAVVEAAADWLCLLTVILSAIGAWFCWRTRTGVGAALNQIAYVAEHLTVIRDRCVAMGLPCPHGSKLSTRQGHRTAEMITLVLFVL